MSVSFLSQPVLSLPLVLYSLLFYLLIPAVLLRLLFRSIREPRYRADILQRFGCFRSAHAGEVIWIHAVSAGETIAAVPLIEQLLTSGHYCLVTNMTPTGRERVEHLLGDRVENCYAPYDLPGSVSRFLRNNQPRMLIVIDTELWPNTLRLAQQYQVKTALVNGRLSARSAERYGRFPGLTRSMLQHLDLIAVQTPAHRERFVDLGADPETVQVTGSIKFDAEAPAEAAGDGTRLEAARALTAGRPLLLAASTHPGEESALLDAFALLREKLRQQVPDLLLVLAPRHTHREPDVSDLCRRRGFDVARFSEGQPVTQPVLIIDAMGELDAFFQLSPVSFVGGSLVPVGGHNLLEAVRAGSAVVMGPHLDNIDDIARQFQEADAMLIAGDAAELGQILLSVYANQERLSTLTGAASRLLASGRGSVARTEKLLFSLS